MVYFIVSKVEGRGGRTGDFYLVRGGPRARSLGDRISKDMLERQPQINHPFKGNQLPFPRPFIK